MQANDRLRWIFQRLVKSFRRPRNLRDLLVRTRSTMNTTSSEPTAPLRAHILAVPAGARHVLHVIHNITCIDLGQDCYVIRGRFDCTSENIVYLIT